MKLESLHDFWVAAQRNRSLKTAEYGSAQMSAHSQWAEKATYVLQETPDHGGTADTNRIDRAPMAIDLGSNSG